MKLKSLLLYVSAAITFGVSAQPSNTLLNRSFWEEHPNVEDLQAQVAAGNDPEAFNPSHFDPMVMALLSKADLSVIEYLLEFPSNSVGKLTHDGRIYAHWAAYSGYLEALNLLIERGSDVTTLDDHGFTVLTFAANAGHTNPELFDALSNAGANIVEEVDLEGANALLLVAPHVKSMDEFQYFVSKGLSLNSTNDLGYNVFDYAAKSGNISIMDQLIAVGIDPFGPRKDNGNAMHMASKGMRRAPNTVEVFEFLKKNGVAPKATTLSGKSSLHILATSSSDVEVFQFFLNEGLSVDHRDENGNTPLLNACNRNTLEVVQLLANRTTDINIANNAGETALSKAVAGNSSEVVRLLLELGADIDMEDTNGNNLAFYVAESNSPRQPDAFKSTLDELLNAGFNLSKPTSSGNNLYHFAAQAGSEQLVDIAKSNNLDINAVNTEGMSPIHLAALKANNTVLLTKLVELGADLSATTEFGETAFDLASENEVLNTLQTDLSFLKNE